MGVWGMAPFESDDYGELTDSIREAYRRAVIPKIDAALTRAERGTTQEKWAAIGIVIVAYQSTYLYDDEWWDLLQRANTLYKACTEDREWLAAWRSARGFKKMFDGVGDELERMADAYGKPEPVLVQLMFSDLEIKPKIRSRRKR